MTWEDFMATTSDPYTISVARTNDGLAWDIHMTIDGGYLDKGVADEIAATWADDIKRVRT